MKRQTLLRRAAVLPDSDQKQKRKDIQNDHADAWERECAIRPRHTRTPKATRRDSSQVHGIVEEVIGAQQNS